MKSSLKPSLLQSLLPVNLATEKQRFLQNARYNPQFIYENPVSDHEFSQYTHVSKDYLEKAKSILDSVIDLYTSESAYRVAVEGRLLSQNEVEQKFQHYLEENNIRKQVKVEFTTSQLSRTYVERIDQQFIVKVRLPIDYRINAFMGTLHHEIGTHVVRWLNEFSQPWHNKRDLYQLNNYVETEEGLASLHGNLPNPQDYLWRSALYYYVAYSASEYSFAELFEKLEKYVDDPERRWKLCLRVKRGFSNTSIPGSFAKDQLYFSGVNVVTQWLKNNAYDSSRLYIGKISISDLHIAEPSAQKSNLIYPSFLSKAEGYQQRVQEIIQFNQL